MSIRVAFGKGRALHEQQFLQAFEDTCRRVAEVVSPNETHDVYVCWNSPDIVTKAQVLCVECGWIPRTSYQVGIGGINADHHRANPRLMDYGRDPVWEIDDSRRFGYETEAPAKPICLPTEYILCPLQVESDTNMLHLPEPLRTQQGMIDTLSEWAPELPIVFKAHCASNSANPVKTRRKHDQLLDTRVGIQHLFANRPPVAVVCGNSNVANDAIWHDIPAIVLGRGIWPDKRGPFYRRLPSNWITFERWYGSVSRRARERARYLAFIADTQWSLQDANDNDKVLDILSEASRKRRTFVAIPEKPTITVSEQRTVNLVQTDRGWLFEDLARYLEDADVTGARCVRTARPTDSADAYLYSRMVDYVSTPAPSSKTTIQVHDTFASNVGRYAECKGVAGWVFVSPRVARHSIPHIGACRSITEPIGAHYGFAPAPDDKPPGARVLWVGRDTASKRGGHMVKIMGKVSNHIDAELLVLGQQCNWIREARKVCSVEYKVLNKTVTYDEYPEYYRGCAVLVITSDTESQPLPLFEALRTGIPVVSTDVGMARELLADSTIGVVCDNVREIAINVRNILNLRSTFFARRHSIASAVPNWTPQRWARSCIEFALEAAGGSP